MGYTYPKTVKQASEMQRAALLRDLGPPLLTVADLEAARKPAGIRTVGGPGYAIGVDHGRPGGDFTIVHFDETPSAFAIGTSRPPKGDP